MQITLDNYPKFLTLINKIISRTITDVNNRKVVMAWEIGKEIETHLLKNNRAEYGEKFFTQLAKDTAIDEKSLYQMRSFYKAYPRLPKKNLDWSHYRNLVAVKNVEKRQFLENLAEEKNLSVKELQQKIRKNKITKKKENAAKKLFVQRGKIFTYKITEINGEKFLDLGFNIFQKFSGNFKADDVVESVKNTKKFSFKKSAITKKEMYCYKAAIERVVDGDTLHVVLDLGFNIFHKEILRLAKINAAERDTNAGKTATKKLKEILKDVKNLVIKTNKTDIYGRYIADIFLENTEGKYLNQMLVDCGAAEAL